MDINTVTLIGRLTRDVESKEIDGKSIVEFSIAVGGYSKDDVSFVDITVFDKVAEACSNNLKQGSRVCINGKLKQERWKTDAGNRSRIKIRAHQVQFLSWDKKDDIATPDPIVENNSSPF